MPFRLPIGKISTKLIVILVFTVFVFNCMYFAKHHHESQSRYFAQPENKHIRNLNQLMNSSEKLEILKSYVTETNVPGPPVEQDLTLGPRILQQHSDLASWFIFSFGFSLAADISPHKYNFSPEINANMSIYSKISHGQVVYVRTDDLNNFAEKVVPTIGDDVEFVLISGDSDYSVPTAMSEATQDVLLKSKKVKVWYTQNLAAKTSPKLRAIPIGNDFHTIYTRPKVFISDYQNPWEQNVFAHKLGSSIPFSQRLPVVYINFKSTSDTPNAWGRDPETSRSGIKNIVHGTLPKTHYKIVYEVKSRDKLWRDQMPYAFVASAFGNGIDCHRTWEALELGQVVIMVKNKYAAFWEVFEGLPVILIDSWKNVTAGKLEEWHKEWSIKLSDPSYYASVQERLHMEYWMKKIRGHF